MFYEDIDEESLAAANAEQHKFEAALRKKGVSPAYTGILSTQAEGPLRMFVVPQEYRSPTNSHKMWKMYVADTGIAFRVDLARLVTLVREGRHDEAIDELPLPLVDYW